MSPWASASPIRTLVTADCSCIDAAELLGDAEHVDAELAGRRRDSSGGVVAGGRRRPCAGGRICSSAKARPASWNICCSSSGVTSNRPSICSSSGVPVCPAAGLRLEGAAGGGRPSGSRSWCPGTGPARRLADRGCGRAGPSPRASSARAGRSPCCARPRSCRCRWSWCSRSCSSVVLGRRVAPGRQSVVRLGASAAHGEVDLAAVDRRRVAKATLAGSRIGLRKRTSTARRCPGGALSSAAERSGPWSTSRARSPPGSRAASRSASAGGSGCGRRRRWRSDGRGRRRAATRRSPGSSVEDRREGLAEAAASLPPLPRRRKVLTLSQAISPAGAAPRSTRVKVWPLRVRLQLRRRTRIVSCSPIAERAGAGRSGCRGGRGRPRRTGSSPFAITAMCSGKASTCG